jgi:hypothetical protein
VKNEVASEHPLNIDIVASINEKLIGNGARDSFHFIVIWLSPNHFNTKQPLFLGRGTPRPPQMNTPSPSSPPLMQHLVDP